MNQTTSKSVSAFLEGRELKVGNTFTDGKSYYLFNNKIAEHRDDGLYVSNAGWFTRTTKERLNGLPNVRIHQAKRKWYLNGEEWDGQFIKVNDNTPPKIDPEKVGKSFNLETKWVSSDGWRGFSQPVYAVCGANDTGGWDDSPCPSSISQKEIAEAVKSLKKHSIPTKIVVTETSNVFCVHRYVIVPPRFLEKARQVVVDHVENTHTDLLYPITF